MAEARFRAELGQPRLTDTWQIGVGVDGHFIHRLAPWTTRPLVGAMLVLALLASLSACGSNEATDPAATSEQTSEPSPPATSPSEPAEEAMDIELTIGDDTFSATLDDSAAGRDLLTQLPVTLEMGDLGSVEKTGALPSPLSLEGNRPVPTQTWATSASTRRTTTLSSITATRPSSPASSCWAGSATARPRPSRQWRAP